MYNIWDRLNVAAGKSLDSSFQRNLIDPASLFGEEIAMAASVAVDRAAGLEKDLLALVAPMSKKILRPTKTSAS